MSTYYYIVCDDHMERTDAASRTAGGYGCFLADGEETLLPFIVTHCGCPVRIVSEHEDDAYDSRFEDWEAGNLEAMVRKDRGPE